jgi:hypothetical protein
MNSLIKLFGGNADKQMERTHYLNNPFWARFIRFYPIEWNEQISMRAGVFGCPYTGQCLPGYFRVNENSNCGIYTFLLDLHKLDLLLTFI